MSLFDPIFRFFESRIDPFKPRDDYEPPSRLLQYVWYYVSQVRWAFAGMLVFGFLAALIEASVFSFIGHLIDILTEYEAGTESAKGWSGLWQAHGTVLLGMAFVIVILRLLVIALDSLMEEQIIVPGFFVLMRWQSHKHIIGQSLSFFQNDLAGRIAQKVFQSGMATGDMMISLLQIIWFIVVYALTTAGVLFALSWQLGLAVAVWLTAFLFVAYYFIPKVRDFARETADTGSGVTGRMVDAYTNIQTVKLYGGEHTSQDGVLTASQVHQKAIFRFTRTLTMMRIFANLVNGLALAIVGFLVIDLWLAGQSSLGNVAFVMALTLRLRLLLHRMLGNLNAIFRNMGVSQNTMELVARPHGLTDAPNAKPFEFRNGEIRFRNVCFNYETDNSPHGILDDVSLHIRPGEKVGIVGVSGAGKTTLVNLLMRFFDPQSGAIEIDGQDIASVRQESLRKYFSLVQQDPQLFHTSVSDNIAYGDETPDQEEVEEAARLANAYEFIVELKDVKGRTGYEARVGERGVKLSGGQRQRIAIARAIYRNAPILVLDEATSQLDSQSEEVIQENLVQLLEGKTALVIAHRLSTIVKMDRIIVMHDGKINAQGTHKELLEHSDLYTEMWQRQTGT